MNVNQVIQWCIDTGGTLDELREYSLRRQTSFDMLTFWSIKQLLR